MRIPIWLASRPCTRYCATTPCGVHPRSRRPAGAFWLVTLDAHALDRCDTWHSSTNAGRSIARPVKYKINVTKLNHSSAGHWLALIVFTVSPISAIPGVGAFYHPAFPQGSKPVLPSGRLLTSRRHMGRWVALQAWRASWWYVLSPKIVSRRGKAVTEISASNCGAALPSSRPAPVIKTARRSPNVSTQRWRFRPCTLLLPSYPRSGPPIAVVWTD